jgi:DHA2 family multidrug resistance protein
MNGRQSHPLADGYLAIAVCFAIVVVMVPLMSKVKPPKAPSPTVH